MQKTSIYILAVTFLFFSFSQGDLSKGAKKKMDKAIAEVWTTELVFTPLNLADIQSLSIDFSGNESMQIVSEVSGTNLGYLVTTQAKGRYDLFDLLIIYDLELNILKTQVLVYREDWGGEISSARWLKQFTGKSDKDKIELTHDIQGISGATISCQSATQEIRRMTSLVNRLKVEGVLNI